VTRKDRFTWNTEDIEVHLDRWVPAPNLHSWLPLLPRPSVKRESRLVHAKPEETWMIRGTRKGPS
jgi:hypothetical protein